MHAPVDGGFVSAKVMTNSPCKQQGCIHVTKIGGESEMYRF
jgi:hypothetical protein